MADEQPLRAQDQAPSNRPSELQAAAIDRRRYLRVVRYFAGALSQLFFWDVILGSVLGRDRIQRSAEKRWRRLARRFRALATELGGVLIKMSSASGKADLSGAVSRFAAKRQPISSRHH